MQQTYQRDVTYAVNVKSIKIVKIQKFASKSAEDSEIALMHARNSVVDQMPCASQATIDRLVFVPMASSAIQTISTWDVSQLANAYECQIYAKAMPTARMVKFVLLDQMELRIV